jgi:hypothetical protein
MFDRAACPDLPRMARAPSVSTRALSGGMIFDDVERPVFDPIAKRNDAPHPYAFLLWGGDLVSDAFALSEGSGAHDNRQRLGGATPSAYTPLRPKGQTWEKFLTLGKHVGLRFKLMVIVAWRLRLKSKNPAFSH